jgi:hypothetical protein
MPFGADPISLRCSSQGQLGGRTDHADLLAHPKYRASIAGAQPCWWYLQAGDSGIWACGWRYTKRSVTWKTLAAAAAGVISTRGSGPRWLALDIWPAPPPTPEAAPTEQGERWSQASEQCAAR